MSVFLVKTLKIRWRLCPQTPFSSGGWGVGPQILACGSFFQILNASLISPLFLVSCFVNLSPSLFFSKPRFISNSNETPNFTVIFIICAKFGVKAGAQNSFLPPGAGYPSHASEPRLQHDLIIVQYNMLKCFSCLSTLANLWVLSQFDLETS